jgi:hypothetical protein
MSILYLLCTLIPMIIGQIIKYPTEYYPAKASPSQPRLWIKGDLDRLKQVYADATSDATIMFKKEVTKMMGYTTASQDWRYASGWPFAALALAYQITGDAKYGTKSINTYLPYFDGVPKVMGRLQSITHWGLGYDWLRGHPDFTDSVRDALANKIIQWSDSEFTGDTTKPSYVAQDSDHMTASTTSHFVCGCALYGDYDKAVDLMDRGWTGVKLGYNNNTLIPYVSIETMYNVTRNGHPLPGWDYFWMSDGWDLQNLWYILDEVGYVSDLVKNWYPKAILYFIHNVDPANTHYRWLGDTQSEVLLVNFSGYIWSWFSNIVYMAERYGFKTEAAQGRSFLDRLNHTPWGVAEGDPMIYMARGFNKTMPRIDYTTSTTNSLPRYVIYEGLGVDQRMGYGYFRNSWTNKDTTWGGFAGVGNYLVDHMHAIHGSYFLWRNGEYLVTDPHNYGGETAGEIYSSLSIPNPKDNFQKGGPIFYYNEKPAYMERGRVITDDAANGDLFYSVVNADRSYNTPYNQWDPCVGCGQPVKTYRRHFLYDGQDNVYIVDKVDMNYANYTSWRMRGQNQVTAPTQVSADTISLPSDKGNYRTLAKILEPAGVTWTIIDENKKFKGVVENYAIDTTMWGSLVKATDAPSKNHLWLAALHIGANNGINTQLDNAVKITNDKFTGIFAGKTILVVSKNTFLESSITYTTPAGTPAKARHVVGDVVPGCYKISGSTDSDLGLQNAFDMDNTLIFTTTSAGTQTITIAQATGCTNKSNNPYLNKDGTASTSTSTSSSTTTSPTTTGSTSSPSTTGSTGTATNTPNTSGSSTTTDNTRNPATVGSTVVVPSTSDSNSHTNGSRLNISWMMLFLITLMVTTI